MQGNKVKKLIKNLMDDMDWQGRQEQEIESFVDHFDEVVADVQVLSTLMIDYVKAAPNQAKLTPPVPAFSLVNHNKEAAQKAVDDLMAMMKELTPIVNDMNLYKDSYDKFIINKNAFTKKTISLLAGLQQHGANLVMMYNANKDLDVKSKHYGDELKKLTTSQLEFVPRLESIKKQIKVIKGVN